MPEMHSFFVVFYDGADETMAEAILWRYSAVVSKKYPRTNTCEILVPLENTMACMDELDALPTIKRTRRCTPAKPASTLGTSAEPVNAFWEPEQRVSNSHYESHPKGWHIYEHGQGDVGSIIVDTGVDESNLNILPNFKGDLVGDGFNYMHGTMCVGAWANGDQIKGLAYKSPYKSAKVLTVDNMDTRDFYVDNALYNSIYTAMEECVDSRTRGGTQYRTISVSWGYGGAGSIHGWNFQAVQYDPNWYRYFIPDAFPEWGGFSYDYYVSVADYDGTIHYGVMLGINDHSPSFVSEEREFAWGPQPDPETGFWKLDATGAYILAWMPGHIEYLKMEWLDTEYTPPPTEVHYKVCGYDPDYYDLCEQIYKNNISLVVAAGNYSLSGPQGLAHPKNIHVGAIDTEGFLCGYSNRGWVIDVTADSQTFDIIPNKANFTTYLMDPLARPNAATGPIEHWCRFYGDLIPGSELIHNVQIIYSVGVGGSYLKSKTWGNKYPFLPYDDLWPVGSYWKVGATTGGVSVIMNKPYEGPAKTAYFVYMIGNSVMEGSGTSWSTPQVAALCNMIYQVNPDLNNDQVKAIIRETAIPTPKTNPLIVGLIPGRNEYYTSVDEVIENVPHDTYLYDKDGTGDGVFGSGRGRINVYGALLKASKQPYAAVDILSGEYPRYQPVTLTTDNRFNNNKKTIYYTTHKDEYPTSAFSHILFSKNMSTVNSITSVEFNIIYLNDVSVRPACEEGTLTFFGVVSMRPNPMSVTPSLQDADFCAIYPDNLSVTPIMNESLIFNAMVPDFYESWENSGNGLSNYLGSAGIWLIDNTYYTVEIGGGDFTFATTQWEGEDTMTLQITFPPLNSGVLRFYCAWNGSCFLDVTTDKGNHLEAVNVANNALYFSFGTTTFTFSFSGEGYEGNEYSGMLSTITWSAT